MPHEEPSMTEPDESEDLGGPADPDTRPRVDPRLSAVDAQASRVDTAMVLGWVGLALVPCCGLGGVVSLFATVLGVARYGAVRKFDKRLAARARGAVMLGLIGALLGAAIIVWFSMTVVPEWDNIVG